jgi:hypothetical protein
VKQEAWIKNKFDEVFAKKGRFEKADVTKQNAEYTPTVNTLVNIIKIKFPGVFAKKGRFKKADVTTQNAEYTPTVNTLVDIVKRNPKNTVKNKPWSALYGRITRGSQCCTRVPTKTCQSQPQPP